MFETHKTYEAQFSKRNQLPGETIEEYATVSKRLYGKAFIKRNPDSRQEALLRRLLNVLVDDQDGFEVEYYKDPTNIDEIKARKAPTKNELESGDRIRRRMSHLITATTLIVKTVTRIYTMSSALDARREKGPL